MGSGLSHTRSLCCCRPWKQTVQADPELREEGDGQWPVLRCSNKTSRQPLTLISLKNVTVIRNLYCFTRRQSPVCFIMNRFLNPIRKPPSMPPPQSQVPGVPQDTPVPQPRGPVGVGFGNTVRWKKAACFLCPFPLPLAA